MTDGLSTPPRVDPRVRLYHECMEDAVEQIRRSGIRPQSKKTADEVRREGGQYLCPESVPLDQSAGYGIDLVHRLLVDNRPDELPSHNQGAFFFGSPTHTMNRRFRVSVEVSVEEYDIVAVDWDVAEELFMDVFREFEIINSFPADALDSLVDQYWESAFVVESPEEVTSGFEYYVTEPVPPSAIISIDSIA